MPTHDPDLGWHLLGGQLILSQRAVPVADPINSFNSVWIDYHWGAQILLALLFEAGGYPLLRIALGLLMALCGYLLFRIVERSGLSRRQDPRLTAALFASSAAGLALLISVASVRPQSLSLALVALAILLIQRRRRYELPLLWLLTVAAVQIHVYWIFIPFIYGIYRVVPAMLRRNSARSWRAIAAFISLLAAAVVSPYGALSPNSNIPWFTNYLLLFDYAHGASELKELIHEFRSGFAADGAVPWILLCMIALSTLALGKGSGGRRLLVIAPPLLLALTGFVLAARTLKFVGIAGIFALPLLAYSVRRIFWRSRAARSCDTAVCGMIRPIAFILMLSAAAGAARTFPLLLDQSGYMQELPLAACRKIPELARSLPRPHQHLRVATHFNYGGWCRRAIQEADPAFDARVTTDGRTQFVPTDRIVASFDLYRVRNRWAETLKEWAPDLVLAEKNYALAQLLVRAEREWKLLYHDERFALFAPNR